jgi:hypothetical protein
MLLQHGNVFHALAMRLSGQAPQELSHRLSAANSFIENDRPSHNFTWDGIITPEL